MARRYVDGRGLAAKILYDRLSPKIDLFSEQNLLIFAVGPLTGTFAPTAGHYLLSGFVKNYKSGQFKTQHMPEYVVTSNLIAKPEEAAIHREDHLNYLARLKKEGRLLMTGRFTDGKGGLYILVADSDDEADFLARADPYHAKEIRQYTIRRWERRL